MNINVRLQFLSQHHTGSHVKKTTGFFNWILSYCKKEVAIANNNISGYFCDNDVLDVLKIS